MRKTYRYTITRSEGKLKKWYYWPAIILKLEILSIFKRVEISLQGEKPKIQPVQNRLVKKISGFMLQIKTTAANLKNCFFSIESRQAEAFVKIPLPNFYWYTYRGLNILKYGSRGYTFEEGCGVSFRGYFWRSFYTYGLLYPKLGFRNTHVISVFGYIATLLVVSIMQKRLLPGVIFIIVMLVSSEFDYAFLSQAKPESNAWFFTPLIIYFAAAGQDYLLSLSLFLLSFMNFSVTILVAVLVGAALWNRPLDLLVITAPTGVKLGIELLAAAGIPFVLKMLRVLSGRFLKGEDQRAYMKRDYGTAHGPMFRYMMLATAAVTLAGIWFHDSFLPVLVITLAMFINNFYFVRINDESSFVHYFLLVMAGAVLLSSAKPVMWIALGILALGLLRSAGKPALKPHRFPAPFKEKFDNILKEHIPQGERLLMEFSGKVVKSRFRLLINLLEYLCYTRGVQWLPNETYNYLYPQWMFEESAQLAPDGDLDRATTMLKRLYINYVLVYSPALCQQLEARGYNKLAHLPYPAELDAYLRELHVREFWLLQVPGAGQSRQPLEINGQNTNADIRLKPNYLVIAGLEKDDSLLLKWVYDRHWKARQGKKKVKIEKEIVHGLPLMRCRSHGSEPMIFTYGRLNYLIR